MKEIRMVDLATQYQQIKDQIDMAIHRVIDNTAFINGPAVHSFKENLEKHLQVKHVIPCANGTDALQLAMMALDLQPGDEVITASFTYVATAEVIALLRLTPVLVDVDEDTFLIDPEKIEKAITPRTKGIVPVHLFGQCADMERIMDIAGRHNLYVIEDTAQAINAEYTFSDGTVKKAGTIGHIGCTSFFPSKNLGCYGDGGAMFTNDDALAAKLRMIANHGQSIQYHHDIIGVNSRLDTIQAAILDVKLKYLDNYTYARQVAAEYYDKAFENHPLIKIPKRVSNSTHVFHQYTLTLSPVVNRNGLKNFLAEHKIPSMIYYPIPLHQQKAYKSDRYRDGDFPVSEKLASTVISLPMHTEFSREQQDYIIQHVLNYLKQYQS